MPRKRQPALYCFSPAAMIATYGIETALAFYVSLRCSATHFRSLVIALILCLASFQLAEFEICRGVPNDALAWTKLGLVGITCLPALGMHLISVVTRPTRLVEVGYGIALLYALTFMLVPGAVKPSECFGNYVMLDITGGFVGVIYEIYYSAFVLLAIGELALRLTEKDPPIGLGYSRKLIVLTLAGYLSFTVPMAIAGMMSAEMRRATPSIMCGFAVSFALILALWVAPLYSRESRQLLVRPAV